jgi:DNA-binding response OmpR family regulator
MNKKILLVDDSPTAILWQRMILEEDRYEIVVASDGEEGLRLARVERPDLVLLDVTMPRMNGFETLRALRADDDLRDTPIIMVTTRGGTPDIMEGYALGCSEYVTKPLDGAELLMKVRSYLHPAAVSS